MHQLSDIELKQLHQTLLFMMVEFDKICKKNDIQYFLGGGTLLGAVRHKGFIPWDDDVDLMMSRANYERLCALPSTEFGDHFFFQTYKTDSHYHSDMAKLRLNGTCYCTEFSSHFPEMHQGIFIDIFAHDKTASHKKMQDLHVFVTTLLRSMVFHKWEKTPMHYYGKHKIICAMVTCLIKVLPMRILESWREKGFRWFENTSGVFLYDGMGMHLQHGAFPAEWLEDVVELEFEGHRFPAPHKYDDYLRYSYGEYEKIPPESERMRHNIHMISFGKY